ncbi:MAG: TIGR01212 family radical SAM protein, partial [Ruminiclostridium sp.]
MNPFPFSDDNKRYHTLSYHNRHTYGKRIFKAVIDAGFTCPNIDGTRGLGGCIFCDGGSGYFTASSRLSVREQYLLEEKRIREKYPAAGIIAYFQAHSNTYCTSGRLEAMLSEAVSCGAEGIAIATRADCIDEEKAEIIASLPVSVTVELGLQTVYDETAARINRCHSFAEFLEGYRLLKNKKIRVCVHIIDGLPGENRENMLESARVLGKLRPDGVKIHLLHVIIGTRLCEMYESGEYTPLEKADYIDTVIGQLELLPPETVIERITGDGDKKKLAAPLWSADKISVLGGIDKRMAELETYQG